MKFLIAICLVFTIQTKAQENNATSIEADTVTPLPSVVIVQDERIEILIDKKIFIPTLTTKVKEKAVEDKRVRVDKFGRVNLPGFRIQLMNSTDRTAVYDMKGKIFQIYPNIKQYVVAQAPFYKLRFGNFKTKDEAERYKKALSPMFPGGIYVVNDIIEAQLDPKTKDMPIDDTKPSSKTNRSTTKPVAKSTTKPTAKPPTKPATKPTAKPAKKPASSAKPRG